MGAEVELLHACTRLLHGVSSLTPAGIAGPRHTPTAEPYEIVQPGSLLLRRPASDAVRMAGVLLLPSVPERSLQGITPLTVRGPTPA